MINIDQFGIVEMRVGKVVEAANAIGSEKLIRLVVDIGEEKPRTIFTGVRVYGYEAEWFVGKRFLFVTNLEPRKMVNDEYSQGMILAVDSNEGKPVFVEVDKSLEIGARVR